MHAETAVATELSTREELTRITCPEDLIIHDVLNICSAIANASEPTNEIAAIFGAILAKVDSTDTKR